MSDTIAIRISTVLPVRHSSRITTAGPILLAVAVAEGARRLLTPRSRVIEPASVELRDYFSAQEIARGSRYARPQMALGLARSAIDLGLVALLARRPPRWLLEIRPDRPWRGPVAGSAGVGAALAIGLTLPTLPLKAVSRRRAMAVGLDIQSWPDWAADLAKGAAIEAVFAAAA